LLKAQFDFSPSFSFQGPFFILRFLLQAAPSLKFLPISHFPCLSFRWCVFPNSRRPSITYASSPRGGGFTLKRVGCAPGQVFGIWCVSFYNLLFGTALSPCCQSLTFAQPNLPPLPGVLWNLLCVPACLVFLIPSSLVVVTISSYAASDFLSSPSFRDW